MRAVRDRMAWTAVAAVSGFVLGWLLLGPVPTDAPPDGVPASPVPLTASVRNAGTEDVRVELSVQDEEGLVVHRYGFIVEAGGAQTLAITDLTEGTFRFVGVFRLDDRPSSASRADLYVEVGECGEDAPAGVRFRVAGTASGVAVQAVEPACP
jgi:hypothetical protein